MAGQDNHNLLNRLVQFDWQIYADATFAGLSPLIPLPLVDNLFEWFFRQRMVPLIARYEKIVITREAMKEIQYETPSLAGACLFLPIFLTVGLARSLSRKVFYFLSITQATNRISTYWHFAFLLRYALVRGHIEDKMQARFARQAIDKVLKEHTTSPLLQLARQITTGTNHVFRSLRMARRGKVDAEIREQRSVIASAWENFDGYFRDVAAQYDRTFLELGAAEEERRRQLRGETAPPPPDDPDDSWIGRY